MPQARRKPSDTTPPTSGGVVAAVNLLHASEAILAGESVEHLPEQVIADLIERGEATSE